MIDDARLLSQLSQTHGFACDLLQISHNKLPKRAFAAGLPLNFIKMASKTSTSRDASSFGSLKLKINDFLWRLWSNCLQSWNNMIFAKLPHFSSNSQNVAPATTFATASCLCRPATKMYMHKHKVLRLPRENDALTSTCFYISRQNTNATTSTHVTKKQFKHTLFARKQRQNNAERRRPPELNENPSLRTSQKNRKAWIDWHEQYMSPPSAQEQVVCVHSLKDSNYKDVKYVKQNLRRRPTSPSAISTTFIRAALIALLIDPVVSMRNKMSHVGRMKGACQRSKMSSKVKSSFSEKICLEKSRGPIKWTVVGVSSTRGIICFTSSCASRRFSPRMEGESSKMRNIFSDGDSRFWNLGFMVDSPSFLWRPISSWNSSRRSSFRSFDHPFRLAKASIALSLSA